MKNLEKNCCKILEDKTINNEFLQLNSIEKVYQGGYVGLLNVNFSMQSNERIVFVGEVQSGKTTLLSLIAGVEKPTNGDILLNGESLINCKIKQRDFGFLEAGLQLKKFKNVKANVCYPLKIRKLDKTLINEKFLLIAKQCGIEQFENKKIKHLSYFEKVKTALARLAIVDRKLYLIDDVFAKLTNNECEKVIQLINKLFLNKNIIICVSNFEIAKKLTPKKVGFLAYSTLCGFGEVYNEKNFDKTIAEIKIYNDNKIACVPCKILKTGKLLVGDNEIDFSKNITSKVFKNAVLCTKIENIKISKKGAYTGKIDFVNKNNIAYIDFYDSIMTMPVFDKFYKVGDSISFDFCPNLCELYDESSERKIST